MDGRRPALLDLALLALAAAACVTPGVTPVGATHPCKVDIFPSTPPSYPVVDIASARVKCHVTSGRAACIEQLKADTCEAGGDTLYAFDEGVRGEVTLMGATMARRSTATLPPPGASCDPICSPGFACKSGVCEPQCNPACEKGEVCTRKRICETMP